MYICLFLQFYKVYKIIYYYLLFSIQAFGPYYVPENTEILSLSFCFCQ